MAGQSDREMAAQEQAGNIKNLYGGIDSSFKGASNRFNNYKPQYSIDDLLASTSKNFTSAEDLLKRNAATDSQNIASDTVARLASQGVTKGSIVGDSINKGQDQVRSRLYDALVKTEIEKNSALTGLKERGNAFNLDVDKLAQGYDPNSIDNIYRQAGIKGNILGLNQANIGNMDDTTWLDDVFAGLNAGANVAKAFIKP